jgi:hypothetical protein
MIPEQPQRLNLHSQHHPENLETLPKNKLFDFIRAENAIKLYVNIYWEKKYKNFTTPCFCFSANTERESAQIMLLISFLWQPNVVDVLISIFLSFFFTLRILHWASNKKMFHNFYARMFRISCELFFLIYKRKQLTIENISITVNMLICNNIYSTAFPTFFALFFYLFFPF